MTSQDESLRILIVDDRQDSANSMSMLLGLTGHQTQTAFDGATALHMADRFRPHVILCDIGLPDISGLEVCRQIRARDWGPNICMIALTGWGVENAFASSMEAGFNHHLVKPVELSDLRNAISEHYPAG